MSMTNSSERTLYLTGMDLRRLRDVIATAQEMGNGATPKGINELYNLLVHATIAPEEYLPANVATLGSKIRIRDNETGKSRDVILALPGDCLGSDDSLSVLDPLGSAVLGQEAGQTFTYAANPSTKKATLEEVIYQPVDCEWC